MVGSRGISWLGFMCVSIDQLNTDLLGESKFDLLAVRGSQLGVAFLNGFNSIFDLGDSDGSFFRDVFTGNTGKGDGLVDAGLDGFGVGNFNGDIDGGDNGHIVLGGLGNLLAVVVAISSMSITVSVSGLADSDHLNIFLLFEGDFDSLGVGALFLLLVRVRADFVVNFFNGFSAHGAGDSVGEFFVNDNLDGQINVGADGFEGRDTHFSDFSNILNSAVVFGFFVSVSSVVRSRMTVSRSGVAVGGGMVRGSRGVVGVVGLVSSIRRSGVGGAAGHEGEECQDSESLEQSSHIET